MSIVSYEVADALNQRAGRLGIPPATRVFGQRMKVYSELMEHGEVVPHPTVVDEGDEQARRFTSRASAREALEEHAAADAIYAEWGPSDEYGEVEAASLMLDHPNVWTDGSLVLDRVTGVSSSGAGFFAHQPASYWDHRRWGHVDQVRSVSGLSSCHGFCSVPGPLQSVQRAEMWGVILALQSSDAVHVVHLGVDNLGVVRHIGRLLDDRHGPTPFELVNDGDLLFFD